MLLLSSPNLWGQELVQLRQKAKMPAMRWQVGDELEYLRQGNEDWERITIAKMDSLAFYSPTQRIAFADILSIRSRQALTSVLGTALWQGGLLFAGVSLINGAINNDQPLIRPIQWQAGLLMVGSGWLVARLARRDYHMDEGWYFQFIDLGKWE